MDTFTIEQATSADRKRLAEMYAADMNDLGEDVTPAGLLELVDATLAGQGNTQYTWVVRNSESVVAGALLAVPFWSLKVAGRALWIEALYVPQEFRRNGLGRQMVDHLLDWAEDNGFRGVELEAYQMNTAASCLYRAIGFRRMARERYCYHFGRDD